MKLIILVSIIIFSVSSYGDWFNGFNNGSSNGYGNAAGDANGAGNANKSIDDDFWEHCPGPACPANSKPTSIVKGNNAGSGNSLGTGKGSGNGWGTGNGNGWGTAKGDADGEVDFAITIKGKGITDMDTAGNWAGNGNTAGNFSGYGQGDNTGYGSNMPFGGNRRYAPAAFAPAATAQPNYDQLKAMWEAQRKQADEMLKRIEAAKKATPKS